MSAITVLTIWNALACALAILSTTTGVAVVALEDFPDFTVVVWMEAVAVDEDVFFEDERVGNDEGTWIQR